MHLFNNGSAAGHDGNRLRHCAPLRHILEWTIKTIDNKPVASYKDSEIYMALWVDSENRMVFDKGEIKQLMLPSSK